MIVIAIDDKDGDNDDGQGSRQTFQLDSPVASDRFDSLAKTNFLLARCSKIHHCIKSSK